MGAAPCSCGRRKDPIQLAAFEAIVAKPLREGSTIDTPDSSSQVSRELSSYLNSQRSSMPKKLAKLFEYHIDHPSASHLQLKFCSMRDSDWKHFTVLFTLCQFVKQLVVWKTSLSSLGFKTLCKALNTLQQLEEVTLEDIGLGHHRLTELAREMKTLNCIRVVSLAVNDLGPEQVEILAPALSQIGSLEEVNLDDNILGDRGCETICKAFKHSRLTFLSVRHNSISHVGFQQLITLGLQHSTLKVFAEGNEIGELELDKLTISPV